MQATSLARQGAGNIGSCYPDEMRFLIAALVLVAALPASARDREGERILRERELQRQYLRQQQPYDPSGTRIFGGQPQRQRSVSPSGSGSSTVPNR